MRPAARVPDSTMDCATASVRYEVTVAGLTIDGTPASSAVDIFSSIPHTGKLKALM